MAKEYIPPLLIAAFAFALGVAVNAFDLAAKVWRLIFPDKSEISLHQKFLAFQPGYFGTDFDGALSRYPGEFVQNATFTQARELQQALDQTHGVMQCEQYRSDGLLDVKSFSEIPADNVLARLCYSAREKLQNNREQHLDFIPLLGGEFVCLELTLGDEAVASYVSITGIGVSTEGRLFPFQVDYLKHLDSIKYEKNSLTVYNSLGFECALDTSEVTIQTNLSQKFHAPKPRNPIRIPLMYTVSVPENDSYAPAPSYTVGTAFLPQRITIHYADGREKSHDVRDLADMWSVDSRFHGMIMSGA